MAFLRYQTRMMYQLLFWAGLSLLVGLAMLFPAQEWMRAFGGMTVAWAVVNALIALFALMGIRRKMAQNADPATVAKWIHQLLRLLWINAGLDVLYIFVGGGLVYWNSAQPTLNGFGWAVVIQGAFLFIFDSWHAARLPKRMRLKQE
ncbi:MAG: hypothetical protein N2554_08605 [Fimbriimonadales bacterium]|nr:hypothetical protein [Fimbriimonadales bacterium]